MSGTGAPPLVPDAPPAGVVSEVVSAPIGPSTLPSDATPGGPAPAPAAAFTPHTETASLLSTLKAPEPPPSLVAPAPEPVAAPAAEPARAAPEPPKPEPAPPAEPAAPAELAAPAEPAPPEPIAYPDWKLPEGLPADKEAFTAYNELLGKHRVPPEVGQELLDLHAASLKAFQEAAVAQLAEMQHRAFAETREGWRKEVMADARLGGAGHLTAMGAVARVRDALVSDSKPGTPQYAADAQAFNEFCAMTGAGDHPLFLKLLHRAARYVDEPGLPPPSPKPPPGNGRAPQGGLRSIYAQRGVN